MYSRCCLIAKSERCFGKKPCCSFLVLSGAYLRALVLLMKEKFKAKWKALVGCLGCYTKPTPMGEPSQGLRIQSKYVRRNSVSEDFWSSSTFEMDNSAVQSQISISSIGTSNQAPLDQQGFDGSVSNPSEFVNHGLLLWNQTRQQWLGNKRSQSHPQVREPRISWNATYDSLLSTKKPFRQPIPLREMVEFLVDIWDQEGLYD
ncbi:hypothetical protein RGQ29_010416 [Quercus rubra]|uniref:Gag1-like clamp domain-containing protein n=2 Tax=Quercus rubra TaxID=3512 RepID=A0AAN7G339_QUERU|nr:hypothetical protein RGQ29_010416 [Quercus rubra]